MPYNKQTIEYSKKVVPTGGLAIGSQNAVISTSPLGSCVAVVAFDKTTHTGGIAHIMLPGRLPNESKVEANKYAENAIENLFSELDLQGALESNVEICIVGGANVLRKTNDTIAKDLIAGILDIAARKGFNIKTTSLGGYERRIAKLNLYSGTVSISIGDKNEEQLCFF